MEDNVENSQYKWLPPELKFQNRGIPQDFRHGMFFIPRYYYFQIYNKFSKGFFADYFRSWKWSETVIFSRLHGGSLKSIYLVLR